MTPEPETTATLPPVTEETAALPAVPGPPPEAMPPAGAHTLTPARHHARPPRFGFRARMADLADRIRVRGDRPGRDLQDDGDDLTEVLDRLRGDEGDPFPGYAPAPVPRAPEVAHDRTAPVTQPRWGEHAAWPPPGNSASGRGVPGCKCDGCRYGNVPGADAVLYTGPDAMWLLWRAAIRDGRYDDIDAYAEDVAPYLIHAPAIATARRIHRSIEPLLQRALALAAAERSAAA